MYDYRKEFPDFDPATMPEIPAGFEDRSWHNDGCPSFVHEKFGLAISIDFADIDLRESGEDGPRFLMYRVEPDGSWHDEPFLETSDWEAVVKASLAAEYIALIGYDPFEDEPTETVDGVKERLASYKEARAEDEKPLRAIAAKWVAKFGLGFHPDTRGADYVDSAGACCLTDAEAAEYDADMQTLAECCDDQYEFGLDAMRAAGLLREGE